MLCRVPALPPDLDGVERAAALAKLALSRLARKSREPQQSTASDRPVLCLSLPEHYAAGKTTASLSKEGQTFLKILRALLPPELQGIGIEPFPFGRAAGAHSLRRALEFAERDGYAIWGGVDTFCEWTVLEALERADRLQTAENVDGVRPGEGAAFLALRSAGERTGVRLIGLGTGREPYPLGSEDPCRSEGLSRALEAAVAPLRSAQARTNCWLLDNSHELYATQELQNIIARFGDVLGPQTDLQMPLKELGDVGAAAMPLLAALSAEAWRLGFATDDTAVVTGCSDGGARGAILLAAQEGFRPVETAA
jgi:hypothetical protein